MKLYEIFVNHVNTMLYSVISPTAQNLINAEKLVLIIEQEEIIFNCSFFNRIVLRFRV